MLERVLAFPDIVSAPTKQDALSELLKGRSVYSEAGPSAALAPFEHSRVSVPDDVTVAPYVEDVVPAEAARQSKGFRAHMMRPPCEVE